MDDERYVRLTAQVYALQAALADFAGRFPEQAKETEHNMREAGEAHLTDPAAQADETNPWPKAAGLAYVALADDIGRWIGVLQALARGDGPPPRDEP